MRNEAVKPFSLLYTLVILGAVWTILTGCGTTSPSRYYTLSPLTGGGEEIHNPVDRYRLSVEVEPIELPKYLERPQIITRLSPNKIQPAPFDRWAEPLEDGFLGVLVENLSHLLWTDKIAVTSWAESRHSQYRVSVEIIQFDGQLGKDVFLAARWTIYDKEKNHILLDKRSSLKEPSGTPSYEALVSAESRLLTYLSREIAEGILSVYMKHHLNNQ